MDINYFRIIAAQSSRRFAATGPDGESRLLDTICVVVVLLLLLLEALVAGYAVGRATEGLRGILYTLISSIRPDNRAW